MSVGTGAREMKESIALRDVGRDLGCGGTALGDSGAGGRAIAADLGGGGDKGCKVNERELEVAYTSENARSFGTNWKQEK